MKTKIIASIVGVMMLANSIGLAAGDDRAIAISARRQTSRIIGLLPASDAVVTFDAKQFFGTALPRILSANQPILAQVMAKLTEAENRTGIDLRKFEQIAVGISYNKLSPTNIDYEPIAIASGDINAGALIAVAKLASKGAYTTESISGRTVYVFSAKDMLQNKAPVKPANSKVAGAVDKAMSSLVKNVAVTAFDKNTLLMGTLDRVRETLDGKSRLAGDITSLLPATATVASFAARFPGGISGLIPIDKDAFGTTIESIQYVSGSFDVNAIGAELQIAARTKKAEDAQNLKDTIDGLAILGKAVIGGGKTPDKQVYARMLKTVKVGLTGSDVTFSLAVPQSDIDILIAGVK